MHCKIEGITHKGEGVGRIDGQAVFVPNALPGETVEIEILEDKGRYAHARLCEVVESSPGRQKPPCHHYYRCGGCAYQHLDYSKQMEFKRQVVRDALQRLGKINIPVNPVIGMDEPWQYRNKVIWHVQRQSNGEMLMGYYQTGSRQIAPLNNCLLISEKMNRISNNLQSILLQLDFMEAGEITLRESSSDHKCMLVLKGLKTSPANEVAEELSELVDSLYWVNRGKYIHLFGIEKLNEKIGKVNFFLSPPAFFQVNPVQTKKMIDLILGLHEFKGETVLDAYCGIGSIALNIALFAKRVVGVESSLPAIKDARYNARINRLSNCEFLHGPCEKILPELKTRYDTVILDPPRSGCRREVVDSVIKTFPRAIIYVSCNPATLARDLALFVQGGFSISEVQPVDMFPQTYHVETVVLMSRVKE